MSSKAIPALAHFPYKPPMSTGTTLIGVEYDGGVLIGADSRTSAGMYVTSRVTNKLTPVTDKIIVCRSGSAADTQALADIVSYQLGVYEIIVCRSCSAADTQALDDIVSYQLGVYEIIVCRSGSAADTQALADIVSYQLGVYEIIVCRSGSAADTQALADIVSYQLGVYEIIVCRSGSAADTQALADIVSYQLGVYEMQYGREAGVEIAAEKFRSMGYEYREDLSASFLVAGWDAVKGGQIYAIPIGGMIIRRRVGAAGSGSTFVSSYLNANFRTGMDRKAAEDLVLKAVTLATIVDGSSGGICRTMAINKDGKFPNTHFPKDMPVFPVPEYSLHKEDHEEESESSEPMDAVTTKPPVKAKA